MDMESVNFNKSKNSKLICYMTSADSLGAVESIIESFSVAMRGAFCIHIGELSLERKQTPELIVLHRLAQPNQRSAIP